VSDFKKLKVWRKAHALGLNVQRVATRIRGHHNASLRNQMERAAMSVPTNIVEGTGQTSGKEFGRFLSIALKSSSELEYHLIVARDTRAISLSDFESTAIKQLKSAKCYTDCATEWLYPAPPRRNVPTS
jgi:four helix bundle protein